MSGLLAIAGSFAGTSDAQTSSGPSAVLTARLAVLQRPQTPSDVPTSDGALLHAIAARQRVKRELILSRDARIRFRPASALLAAFAGARSLCVAVVDKPRFPRLLAGTGAGMGCSRDVASAVSGGAGISSDRWHYGVLPNTKPTLTISTGPHSHKTIHPPDGVYIYRTGG